VLASLVLDSRMRARHPILIVGAGPAGLATAAELTRLGIEYRLFERGPTLGNSWVNAYDSLRLHTGRHMSTLPGLGYPSGTPLFPSRDEFVSYLNYYAERMRVRVEIGCNVSALRRDGEHWIATMNDSGIPGSAVVMATGIMSNPQEPFIAGRDTFRGTIIHSSAYQNPEPFRRQRVLVIGVGNSGGEIASEVGAAGAEVTILVRQGANVVPRTIAGVPIQYLSMGLKRLPTGARHAIASVVQKISERRVSPDILPRPPWTALDRIPVIGFHLVESIRAGKVRVKLGTIERLSRSGVVFSDGTEQEFDHIILATGFAPALSPLGDLIRHDDRGFALRTGTVASADQPSLWFVGMRYDSTGAIANIKADAIEVARRLAVR
jgi:cation diffusion facilitator CzcD-associated flavoprotein CzcO